MLRTFVPVTVLLVACGGDDSTATPDAHIPTVTQHDLSCIGNTPTPPTTVHFDSTLLDVTLTNPFPTVPNAEHEMYSLDGTTLLASGTSDADGNFALDIPTGGQLQRVRSVTAAPGYLTTHEYRSIAPWENVYDPDRVYLLTARQPRIDAIATALGATIDPGKGSLEVWMIDCSGADFPGETLSIEQDPGAQWAMFGGVGVWIPRATTIKAANQAESVAGTVNLSPGMKTITWTASGRTLGPVTFYVEAGVHTYVVLLPGYP